uniref:Putative E3 ubiquitin-protein ligase RLIM n=1 Tax=Davidia involucrata TaxID=16924 RepID=A0A5B7AV22_DAVIN
MTSASELFYNRRSRLGRNTVELELDSSLDRNFHHNSYSNRRQHNNTHRDRHDLDDCDPLRRSSYLRHPSHRPSYPEREAVRFDQASGQSASGNIVNSENFSSIRNRLRSNGNDRLPGAVLLARERLLERLRGVSLSGNRRSNRVSSGIINHDDFTFRNDFRLADAGDWETEISREWQAGGTPFIDSIIQTERLLVPEGTSKRPPGLTKEALDCLHLEVFSNTEDNDEGTISRASRECSICLESFLEGDELIRLPCGHRFHSCCLDPWIRSCGDCPYCRAGIVVTSYRAIKRT